MLVIPLGIAWFSAIVLAFLDGQRRWVGWLAAAALAASFVTMLWLGAEVLRNGPQVMVTGGWPAGVGIVLRADLMGITFSVVSLGVLLAALVYEVMAGVREWHFPAVVLFTAAGLSGLFLTGDAFNFYVFFEVAMTSSFVLAGYGQERREMRAALIFMVVNLLGSVLFLSGVALLYRLTGTLYMQDIAARIASTEPTAALLVAVLLFAAFSVKLGLFPFHFWLPLVYRDARPAVAAILSGAIANVGAYGLLRFGADILSREREMGAVVLLVLGSASVVYGAYQAVAARPAAAVLAYSSVSQAGYVLIALGVGGVVGVAAAVTYAVINALNKTVLFLAVGLRGWLVGAAFAIGAFSVAGVPPAAGFFGKAALFRASVAANSAALVLLVFVGGALAFVYMFQRYQHDYWSGAAEVPVSPLAPRLLVLALAGVVLAVGIWPQLLLDVSEQIGHALTDTITGGLP